MIEDFSAWDWKGADEWRIRVERVDRWAWYAVVEHGHIEYQPGHLSLSRKRAVAKARRAQRRLARNEASRQPHQAEEATHSSTYRAAIGRGVRRGLSIGALAILAVGVSQLLDAGVALTAQASAITPEAITVFIAVGLLLGTWIGRNSWRPERQHVDEIRAEERQAVIGEVVAHITTAQAAAGYRDDDLALVVEAALLDAGGKP